MKKHDLHTYCINMNFHGSILVTSGSQIEFQQAYGLADRVHNIPNSTQTRFGMASGCKIFTAIAILQLIEKGCFSLDSRIRDVLPLKHSHFHESITVHQLLTHTSGIPDYFDEEKMDDFEDLWRDQPSYRMESPADFLPLFEQETMKSTPGERFSYNNSGYVLLGLIIEKHAGITFSEYVETHIFEAAGMEKSGYFRMDQMPDGTATGYIGLGDGLYKSNIYSLPVKGGPDGGAYTTTEDVHALLDSLFKHRLLTKESTDLLLNPHVESSTGTFYGYGIWMIQDEGEARVYSLMGLDPGVSFRSMIIPEEDRMITILSNCDDQAFSLMTFIRSNGL
ncbi:serine hydrolase [Rossellomorea marisflavi]|uniref:serine hydrolase domain-containing protein n=1 Tax=Rossellomorea marisflavi TaxID=189381 RepID=UPI00285316F1|nr:serine hydrolase [Rossellomorea marisflavi]MDR4937848.1 serine hydrolase [Rossellomorea marisflavi]